MKILQIGNVPLDPYLGSGKKRLAWLEGLRKRGHKIDIYEPKDFEIGYGKISKAKKFRQALGAYKFIKNIQWRDYDIIEFTGDEFWLLQHNLFKQTLRPLLVASTDGLELLANESEFLYQKNKYLNIKGFFNRNIHHRLSWLAFKNADRFVSIASLDRNYVVDKKLFTNRTSQVIPCCIDEDFFIEFNPVRENRVAFTGSWIDRKGIDIVSQIMSKALSKDPTLNFDVYGTSGNSGLVKSYFPLEVRQQVHVYPKISNQELSKGLSKAKVYLFPTQYEGFGIATAEAMASGCAIITTPTGLGWELTDGENGMVCNFSDKIKMLKNLEMLLENEDMRIKISKKGWEFAQKFRWDQSIELLEKTYWEWLEEWKQNQS